MVRQQLRVIRTLSFLIFISTAIIIFNLQIAAGVKASFYVLFIIYCLSNYIIFTQFNSESYMYRYIFFVLEFTALIAIFIGIIDRFTGPPEEYDSAIDVLFTIISYIPDLASSILSILWGYWDLKLFGSGLKDELLIERGCVQDLGDF